MSNYQQHFHQIVKGLNERKKLLLHVCCGPCSVYPLILLDQYFDITIYYDNDNIFPREEYHKRLNELERYLEMIKGEHDIKLVVPKDDQEHFQEKLKPYAREKEGQRRCFICYAMRMKAAFAYASKHHFDYCTTIMSISQYKKVEYIHTIGMKLEKLYPVKFLDCDLKKDDGLMINQKMNAALDLYHQRYCGCPYSYHKENG